jgi:hypothetical protein
MIKITMNENLIKSFKQINILSRQKANGDYTGAITVNGGVGVKKNLYVKEEIVGNELLTVGNARIGKNIFVMGKIESDQMFYVDKDETLVMKRTIVPFDNCNIGTSTYKWNTLYISDIEAENIDVDTLCVKKIVSEYQEEEILEENCCITVESNTILIDNQVNNSTVELEGDNTCMFIKVILTSTVGQITVIAGSTRAILSNIGDFIEILHKNQEMTILKKIEN